MIPLFYNIDVLRSAGFSRPPRNRSELLEISRALAGEGRFGLGLALGPEDVLGLYRGVFPWFWAAGTALVQEGGPAFSGRAFTETLDFLAQLYREGLIPPDAFSKTGEQRLDDFVRGRSAMMTASIRDIGLLRERFLAAAGEGPDRFGITAVPGPDAYAGKPVFGLTSWYAGLSAQSDHPEEGRAFLAFLGERAPLLAAAAHAVPGSAASGPPGAGPDHAAEDPLYSKAWDMSEAGEMAREFYGLPRFEERALLFRGELQKLFEGRQSSAETAAAIQQGWERLGG
jgi:multiple sugar transport system substrate-binding protein